MGTGELELLVRKRPPDSGGLGGEAQSSAAIVERGQLVFWIRNEAQDWERAVFSTAKEDSKVPQGYWAGR